MVVFLMLTIELLQSLRDIFGEAHVLADPLACEPYSHDTSSQAALPEAVVFPKHHDQVVAIVNLCHQHQIPLTARGAGSGTTGGATPIKGGIVIVFEQMNQILTVDPVNRIIVSEVGVTNSQIQEAAKKHGLFWAPDPGSAAYCTLGGNLAFNAAGPRAIKYGTPRENTLGLKAVAGTGQTIRTGVYTTKGVVGYDLTRLLIGSEGTLAVITEATLKLIPIPPHKRTLRLSYNSLQQAAHAIIAVMSQAFTPCALELLDKHSIHLIRHFIPPDVINDTQSIQSNDCTHSLLHDIPDAAQAVLIIEVDGTETTTKEAIQFILNAANNSGLIDVVSAQTPKEIENLWQVRKRLSLALPHVAPKKVNEDVVVPLSNIHALIVGIEQLKTQYQLAIVSFGHAGNGNLHVNIMLDPTDPIQQKNARACLSDLFDLVLKLQGTLSGEHGVGLEKRDFITREIDANTLTLMRNIKRVFDPNNILNPTKIFPIDFA